MIIKLLKDIGSFYMQGSTVEKNAFLTSESSFSFAPSKRPVSLQKPTLQLIMICHSLLLLIICKRDLQFNSISFVQSRVIIFVIKPIEITSNWPQTMGIKKRRGCCFSSNFFLPVSLCTIFLYPCVPQIWVTVKQYQPSRAQGHREEWNWYRNSYRVSYSPYSNLFVFVCWNWPTFVQKTATDYIQNLT